MTEIFVFGSNLAGYHGAGAAEVAMRKHGVIAFRGMGIQGSSYAIPTKDQMLRPLTLPQVERYIHEFIKFANKHQEYTFKVTQIGCGYAGFIAEEIAPLFRGAPDNCTFDTAWKQYLGEERKYWGTFDAKGNRRTTAKTR